jgi:hypothetical protein
MCHRYGFVLQMALVLLPPSPLSIFLRDFRFWFWSNFDPERQLGQLQNLFVLVVPTSLTVGVHALLFGSDVFCSFVF